MKLQSGNGGAPFVSELFLSSRRLADGVDNRFVQGEPFQVAKTGTFQSPIYGEIEISPQDLATMYRNFKTKTPLPPTQLPIDYDHLSDEPQKPEDGRAAGWVEDLEIRDGGNTLWATPKWTRRGAELIANGEYRWCSPYFLTDYMDKHSGEKIGPTLKAIAITNRPFLEGMSEIPAPAIAASERVPRRVLVLSGREVVGQHAWAAEHDTGPMPTFKQEHVRAERSSPNGARALSELAEKRGLTR